MRPRHPGNALLREYQGTPVYAPDLELAVSGTFVPFPVPRPTTVGARFGHEPGPRGGGASAAVDLSLGSVPLQLTVWDQRL